MLLASDSVTLHFDWNLIFNVMVGYFLARLLIWGLTWLLGKVRSP